MIDIDPALREGWLDSLPLAWEVDDDQEEASRALVEAFPRIDDEERPIPLLDTVVPVPGALLVYVDDGNFEVLQAWIEGLARLGIRSGRVRPLSWSVDEIGPDRRPIRIPIVAAWAYLPTDYDRSAWLHRLRDHLGEGPHRLDYPGIWPVDAAATLAWLGRWWELGITMALSGPFEQPDRAVVVSPDPAGDLIGVAWYVDWDNPGGAAAVLELAAAWIAGVAGEVVHAVAAVHLSDGPFRDGRPFNERQDPLPLADAANLPHLARANIDRIVIDAGYAQVLGASHPSVAQRVGVDVREIGSDRRLVLVGEPGQWVNKDQRAQVHALGREVLARCIPGVHELQAMGRPRPT